MDFDFITTICLFFVAILNFIEKIISLSLLILKKSLMLNSFS